MGNIIIKHYKAITGVLCAVIFLLSMNITANVSAAIKEEQVRATYAERDRRLDTVTHDIFVGYNCLRWGSNPNYEPQFLTLKDAQQFIEENMK